MIPRLALALVASLGACRRDSPPPPAAKPSPAALDGGVAPAPAASLRTNLARIAAGNPPERTCFAIAQDRQRVACDTGFWSNQEGVSQSIEVIGTHRDYSDPEWLYAKAEGMGHDDRHSARDRAALDQARAGLEELHFVANTTPEHALGDGDVATVGDWIVRRTRPLFQHEGCPAWDPKEHPNQPEPACGGSWDTHHEKLEVQCQGRWAAIPFEDNSFLDVRYDTPRLAVSALTDRLMLVVVEAHWCIEGECGGSRAAAIVEIPTVCR